MTYEIVPDPKVDASLRKMWQKDSVRFNQIEKKLRELAENPETKKAIKKTAERILEVAYRALCPHV
jgi:mRNA-degrading endonuclease RelE of RelBE toxin-antitoxin system